MKINKKQKELLKSFTCSRLASDEENQTLLANLNIPVPPELRVFYASLKKIGQIPPALNTPANEEKIQKAKCLISNANLLNCLKSRAWKEDLSNSIAYYVVKDKDNNIVFIFSLQNGALYDFDGTEELRQNYTQFMLLTACLRARKDFDANKNVNAARTFLINNNKFNLSQSQIIQEIKQVAKNRQDYLNILQNKKHDIDKRNGIQFVLNMYPAEEIVIFWKNLNYNIIWENLAVQNEISPKNSLGSIIFWYFIPKIIKSIQKQSGCKYIYLFAADSSVNSSLIAYYNELGFQEKSNLCTIKPSFDFSCKFMNMTTEDLFKKQKDFFDNFNIDKDDLVV